MPDIYFFGDSHVEKSFKNLHISHHMLETYSITMHRIGRDNIIPKFVNNFNSPDSIFVICYGEVDCRCHIGRQILAGREEDEIINTLALSYFNTIKNNIHTYKKIIICGIIPPTRQHELEEVHGPITHEFPFVGTDIERIIYTNKLNKKLEELCTLEKYIFFNPYSFYKNSDDTLNFELSDTCGHIGHNKVSTILEQFELLINSINSD